MKTFLLFIRALVLDLGAGSIGGVGRSELRDFMEDLADKRREERIANWGESTAPSPATDQGKLKITVIK
jgi:hypothetical protein